MLIWRKGEPMEKTYKIVKTEKEEQINKIVSRKLMVTRKLNQFIEKNNHIDNLLIEDKFLRPLDSNIEMLNNKK